MPSFWLINLALNCIDLLSWPLLALVYPLCASIQAIESDSHSDTLNLISYWILLSLIYLFEYAFLSLLQWFQYWAYMKLMIIVWLVIPDFGRASYVYNHFVRSCISMNTQSVIIRFRNWKKLFVKNENFLMQAENYIQENGTEAIEELIASKIPAKYLNKEATEVVPATEKNEMPQYNHKTLSTNKISGEEDLRDGESSNQVELKDSCSKYQIQFGSLPDLTNEVKLQVEQKGIKVLEMIETEKVIPERKKDNTEVNVKENTNTSCAVIESEGNNTDSSQICTSKKIQKEWTCAICQVKTSSEQNLKSHFYGRKHKANCEALKAKNKDKQNKSKSCAVIESEGNNTDSTQICTSKKVQKEWTCAICQVKTSCEQKLKSHFYGSKHKANCEALKAKNKDEQNKSKGVHHHGNTKVQEMQNNVGMKKSRLRCETCNVQCLSEVDMALHLDGKRHLDQILEGPVVL